MEELETIPQAEPAPEEAAAAGESDAAPVEAAESEAPREAEPLPAGRDSDSLEPAPAVTVEELLAPAEGGGEPAPEVPAEDSYLRAVLEAIVYVAEEPLTLAQIASALGQSQDRVRRLLEQLIADLDRPEHGITIREVAGGYKIATKPEHHEAVRSFVKSLKPPLKLSLPALETLAVIAYKQPVTSPEIREIRGVQGTGVLNTLLDRKLITAAGRKNVIGKPILYKTTKEFLIQFGLKDLSELPSLKEFEEIRRLAMPEDGAAIEVAPVSDSSAGSTEAARAVEEPEAGDGMAIERRPVAGAEAPANEEPATGTESAEPRES